MNEYLNDCEVIENGQHKWVSPMEWIEKLVIHGIQLEAFTTSGGLGTMCETYLGKVDNLDYKSIRYPGHVHLCSDGVGQQWFSAGQGIHKAGGYLP